MKRTPFHNVCQIGSSILVEKLISKVKDINMPTKYGQTPFSLAYIAWQRFEVEGFTIMLLTLKCASTRRALQLIIPLLGEKQALVPYDRIMSFVDSPESIQESNREDLLHYRERSRSPSRSASPTPIREKKGRKKLHNIDYVCSLVKP